MQQFRESLKDIVGEKKKNDLMAVFLTLTHEEYINKAKKYMTPIAPTQIIELYNYNLINSTDEYAVGVYKIRGRCVRMMLMSRCEYKKKRHVYFET